MYHPSNPGYHQARAIKKGSKKLPAGHQRMVDWISHEFNVRALDFHCYTKDITSTYREQVITIILETFSDCVKIETPENEATIREGFSGYLFNFNAQTETDPFKRNAWPSNSEPIPKILITFCALETLEWTVAWKEAATDVASLKSRFDFLWDVHTDGTDFQTVFFFKNSQLTQTNCDAIRNALLVMLKKYDEFGYFGLHSFAKTTSFDTKENFDLQFNGEVWKYFR